MDLSPLWDIRIRTPRLELKLPSDHEVEELFEVAAAGIHPPDEMPFGIAWTDNLDHDDFVAYHRSCWDEWSPQKWRCNFVTLLGGDVIGTQGMEADHFASERMVQTGSWLGAPFQGGGYGTEQRAAILEFVFRELGARAALSGALIHNVASQRVSEKLGYTVTGMSELAPRGEPIPHYDYRMERDEWRSPVPVEVEGLESARPLFGAA